MIDHRKLPRKLNRWEGGVPTRNNSDDFILHEPTEDELKWRQRGYLDCLRALAQDGPPDPKYVEWLCMKTNQPFVSLTYLEDLRRKLSA